MTLQSKPTIQKLLGLSILIMVFGIVLYSKSVKEKTEYMVVSGKIDFIKTSFDFHKKRDHRFIQVEGHDQIFDIFIGNKFGDFSPKFEKIDDLNMGDEINVYYSDEPPFQKGNDFRLNKNVEFIDKSNQPYFIRGNKNKFGGIGFIVVGTISTIILAIALKKISKID